MLSEQPEDVRRLRPDLPEGLGRIVRKSIEKEQGDRYASAAAMRDDLLAFAEGRPVLGRPVSRFRHFGRRHRGAILAAAAVALVAFGVFLWKQNEPGSIEMALVPHAWVSVNGEAAPQMVRRGQRVEYPPGAYTLVFKRELFRSQTHEVELAPGELELLQVTLEPVDPDDRTAHGIMLADLGIETDLDLTKAQTHRGRGGADGVAVLPSGRIRPDDLDTYYLLLDDDAPEEGFLAFWRVQEGERELLYREPLAAEEYLIVGRIPPTVRETLRPGDVVEWGFVDARDEGFTGTFQVEPLTEAQASVMARVREETAGFDPATRALIEARVLLAEERPMSAYLTLRRVAIPSDREGAKLLPWALMLESLRILDQEKSPWGAEAAGETQRFPAEVRAKVYGD